MTYRERRQRRADRLREWSEKRRQKSAACLASAQEIASHIPMGQPILVGHHSERRHRRDLSRIERGIEHGVEHHHKADEMANRADEIDRQADRAIYSDDPDAIEQLASRIAELEAVRDRRKAINREIRKGDGWEARVLPPLTDDERADLLRAAQFSGCQGYPPYSLQNLSGNINRQKARLTDMRKKATPQEPAENPIAEFAAALNPPGGALADSLPFSLTPPKAAPADSGPIPAQADLFTEPEPCE